MAKGLYVRHDPGWQDTSSSGRRERPGPCLQETPAPDGVSPFTAVPVPWSLLSGAVPLCCLPTQISAESRHLNVGAAPSCPMASCTHCADCSGQEPDGQLCPDARNLTGELPLWVPGSRAKCKLYLVFPRVGT